MGSSSCCHRGEVEDLQGVTKICVLCSFSLPCSPHQAEPTVGAAPTPPWPGLPLQGQLCPGFLSCWGLWLLFLGSLCSGLSPGCCSPVLPVPRRVTPAWL